ncbi:CHASE2 domain-containing protein [Chamaesiphon sp. VAR_48_metabat_135_sub]|uniref:CHASE2 domain-containing protein n=1 Tax=Chamaesiphon sp. VAR_48_metabat_135_sub TaxID=2964699 RepID=UPI00286BC247|nr:CHASE2 domain-containing protein [Chamaesiphon sp. VAR_48_metabat_135_sub]
MSKRAILRCDGTLERGFGVILEIRAADSSTFTEVTGDLPPAIDLLQLLTTWQHHYLGSVGVTRISLENIGTRTGNLSEIVQCRQLAKELEQALKTWLASAPFQPIEQRLRETLTVQDSVELLLRTKDVRLHRLPWHLWDFIERYPHAELSIGSAPQSIFKPQVTHHKVRILAILGDRQGIDIEADRQLLASLPETDVVFLVEPSREEVYSHLWEQAWDVLFFAGHSNTEQQQGRIHLSGGKSLTIDELRYGLRRSIGRGLQLAIFNSCDGLGLAYELEQLHLPHSIVMREPVPDRVALTFLKQFLSTFAGGAPLYTSVRQARECLQGLEGEFPCASWLPVIFQNPAVPTLTWHSLQGDAIAAPDPAPVPIEQPKTRKQLVLWTLFASFTVTGLTIGIRYLGLLQAWELTAFDTAIRLRPAEKPDSRLLIVTVTEADVGAQKRSQEPSRGSLSDESLAKLVEKLEVHQPIAIGLDIYRDYPVSKTYPTLAAKLRNKDSQILGVCKASEPEAGDAGVAPPPEIPPARLGFSDLLHDPDRIVRRHYLAFTPPTSSACQASYSLSVQLALRYLATKGINLEFTPQEAWKLGKLTFTPLEAHTGGYQKTDAMGHQILLNYRSTPTPLDLAPTVAMADVLAGKIHPAQVKDRLILIGTTADSFHDYVLTPYTTIEGNVRAIPGVVLQAQMVSQLLSAVLDGRALIRSWDLPQEAVWIWGWAMTGGILAIWLRRPIYLVLGTGIAICILSGVALILLQGGYWVPLIPAAIAIVGTQSIISLVEN